jgi:predicted metal-dependent enzyme (double-stranded beta helix superfamily)
MFELDRFIADLRASLAERSRQATREVVARAVSDPVALRRALGEPDEAGITVLHRAADLTVIDLRWAPGQVTFPHNHMLSAVIGLYGGREDNMFWRRVPNAAGFQIEAAGGLALGSGDTTILGRDIIHSVVNPLSRISGAIHVYDGDFLGIERSMWDAETLTEQPYDIAAVAKGMAVQQAR